ncbi:MAG: GNAT family N-acetyltransferase [Gammaproteobacteria bacterium]
MSQWVEEPFVLSYRLGEMTLFTRGFRALRLVAHYLDLPPDPGFPPPPVDRLGAVDVLLTRSHPIAERLPVVSPVGGAVRYVLNQYARHYTPLTGGFDRYLAGLSGKTRNTLRRKVKRIMESGTGSEMRSYRTTGEIEEFLRLARGVSALTYQERLLDAGLPATAEFAARLKTLAERDAVRAYLLFHEGKPIAYLCCPEEDGILLYLYVGYDPGYAELSPGTVLQYLAFQALFGEQRFRAFDFTEGEGPHKKLFGTDERLCADIVYFAPTWSNRFWFGLHRSIDRASEYAGRVLERVGLKAIVRRLIRRL